MDCAQRLAASKIVSPTTESMDSPVSPSAQRLAASKIVSQGQAFGIIQSGYRCSTPCGIKDSFTVFQLGEFAEVNSRAQRLAASKIVSPPRSRNGLRLSGCAQRLAAYKIGSHACIQVENDDYAMCSTPCGIKDSFTNSPNRKVQAEAVLNALRHQR